MRASDLRALIIARIEALTVDDKASSADLFRHDADQTDDEVRPERSFILVQGQLSPTTTFTALTVTATFRLQVYYADTPTVGDRICDDGERIIQSLHAIGAAMHPHITGTVDLGDWIPGTANDQVVCAIDFTVSYTLTGV